MTSDSGRIEGGKPPFIPPEKGKEITESAIGRIKKIVPSNIPLVSISFPSREELMKKLKETFIPALMRMKALSVFTTKNLMTRGNIKDMQGVMTGFGGLFVGINFPVAVLNTFSLAKNWKQMGAAMKAKMGAAALSAYLMTSAGVALLISSVPVFSNKLGMARSMQAMKVGMILGPIGMGVMSTLNLAMGAVSTKQAVQSEINRKEVSKLKDQTSSDMAQKLTSREASRYSAKRDFSLAKAAKFFLIAAGVGLGAIAMAGLVAGMTATPFFWAAIGAIGVSFAIEIAIFGVRKVISKRKEAKETVEIARPISEQLKKVDFKKIKGYENFNAQLDTMNLKEIGRRILPHVKEIINSTIQNENPAIKKYFNDKNLDALLNESSWPGNSPLIEIIATQFSGREK